MKTLAATLVRGNNNFDLIRLLAALAVMLGHSYGFQAGSSFESMLAFTHLESFGSLAVYAFFMISGMLVSASFVQQRSAVKFIGLRAVRIWPAAMVCAVFIAVVVGPSFSRLPSAAYFSDPQLFGWLFHNMSLLGRVGGPLPGLFDDSHAKSLVNAPVWTLPVELKCYLIVLAGGLLGALGSAWRTLALVALGAAIFAAFATHPSRYFSMGDFFTLQLGYSFYPVPFFLLGMLLHAFRASILLSWKPVVLLSAGYLALRYSVPGTVLFYTAFVYGVLWLASADALRKLKPRHDYSYGVYLYGFVVQQIVSVLYPAMNNYLAFAVALPFTLALAALSWHLVERPCLVLVRHRCTALDTSRAAHTSQSGS